MLYCLQFKSLRRKIERFEDDPVSHGAEIDAAYAKVTKMARTRYIYKKMRVVFKRLKLTLFK